MKIKLCGFSETKSLSFAVESGCDFVGVVFVKNSIRYVNPIKSKVLSEIILSKSSKVAVVANHQLDDLKVIYENFAPDYFQLHGSENVDYIINLKKHFPKIGIIKAFAIENSSDLLKIKFMKILLIIFFLTIKTQGVDKALIGNISRTLIFQSNGFYQEELTLTIFTTLSKSTNLI